MARKIVITSGKGGVGKTTVTANLGISLAKKSLRVALVDLDLGLNNLDVAVSAEDKVLFDMADVVNGRCRVKQALVQDKDYPSLFLLPCSHRSEKLITPDDVKGVVDKMDCMFDYILFDCPAGVESGFVRAVSVADEAFVVCTPHLSSIRDASKVISLLQSRELMDIRVIVNRLRGDLVASGNMIDAFEVFAVLNAAPLGIIPEDDCLNCCGVVDDGDDAFDILADNVHNGRSVMVDCVSKQRNKIRIKSKKMRA